MPAASEERTPDVAERAPAHVGAPVGPSGARSAALVGAASLAGTALNYVFLLAAGRMLGSDDYGALAALLGVLTVVLLPTAAIQLAVSREVAHRLASGDADGAASFSRAIARAGAIATVPAVLLALALVVPLRELVSVDSTAPVVLTALGVVPAILLPLALGVLQGQQRFHAVATMYVLPFALRLVLFAAVAALGFRVGGAIYAAVFAGIACAAASFGLLTDTLARGRNLRAPPLRPFLSYLWPVVVGLVGIAVLTNIDIVVVRARFPGDAAGEYAAASAFARVALFLPAALLAVLFPRTAARMARGEETDDILGRSLIATAGIGALLVLVYAAAGRGLVGTSFGSDFTDGGDLLALFALSTALFSIANVLLGFHLSEGNRRFAWVVAAFVPVQLVVISTLPQSPQQVVVANLVLAAVLLVAHELVMGSSVPAVRAGAAYLWRDVGVPRPLLREALLATVAVFAFVVVLLWPITSRLTTATVGDPGTDSAGAVAWFWQLQHEGGYHVLGSTLHTLSGAPFGWVEANGLHLQSLLAYYPGYLLTKVVGPIGAFNLVLVLGYALSGLAMYALVRVLGCGRLVGAWAALVYVVFPWHLERAQHGALVHLQVFPLLLLALVAALRRPSTMRFALVGAVTLAAWLTFGYFGAMAAISAVAFVAGAVLVVGREPAGRRFAVGSVAAAAGATLLLGLVTLAPGVDRGESLARDETGIRNYGLALRELVVPPPRNIVVGDRLAADAALHLHGSNATEATNYLGLLTIGLAVAWLALAIRRRRRLNPVLAATTVGLVAVALVAIAFALPSPLEVAGHSLKWTPSRVLWEVLSAFRAPARWSAVVMTALVPLAALALQALVSALTRRAPGRRWLPAAAVATACVVSFLELATPPADPAFSATPAPDEYAAVARAPDGILAEYPLKASTITAFWQREHGRPVLNGAPPGTRADDVARTLVDPAAPGTAAKLARLGVTTILTRPTALAFKSEATPSVPNASWGPGYRLLGRSADGSSVWRVDASPAPVLPLLARSDFPGPLDPQDGVVRYPLGGASGRIVLEADEAATVLLHFDAYPTSEEPLEVVLTGASGEARVPVTGHGPVAVPVAVPRGRSTIRLSTAPEPAPGVVPVEITSPWAEPTTTAPVVTAAPA